MSALEDFDPYDARDRDMERKLDEDLDGIEDGLRKATVGDRAHMRLFALAQQLQSVDPIKYKKIIERCRNGHYHDFATKVATPKMDMHKDLLEVGLVEIDKKMQEGEYDS